MPPAMLPDSLSRLLQDHIDLRLALNVLEGEVDAVAQYHEPDGERLGNSVQYFATFLAGGHHPVEDLLHSALMTRAPAADIAGQHSAIVARVGDLSMMVRNLFIDAPKWRIPFCATARAFIIMKRDHIRGEENALFPLAVKHLTTEDWQEIDRAARGLMAGT